MASTDTTERASRVAADQEAMDFLPDWAMCDPSDASRERTARALVERVLAAADRAVPMSPEHEWHRQYLQREAAEGRAERAEAELGRLTDELNEVGADCSRLENDILDIHDALEEMGFAGAINASSILERLARLRAVEQAAREVEKAHRAVIEGVTPKHPNWCADDHEAYSARFSVWHGACRVLRSALSEPAADEERANQ